MKKGKKKKKGGGAFKVTVKSEDPAAEKAEMQMKKKILEDKNGFIYNDKGKQNIYRTNIDYILNGQDNVTSEENLEISAGSEIRIRIKAN